MIPPFTDEGFLPPGVHTATLAEFQERFVNSTSSARRRELWAKLSELIRDAQRTTFMCHIYIAGSFVTAKPDPNDFDCLLVLDPQPSAELRPFEYNLMSKRARKRRFGGDVFAMRPGSPELQRYLQFFQRSRNGKVIGIVEVTS